MRADGPSPGDFKAFFFFFFLKERVSYSVCSPGWPGPYDVCSASLKHTGTLLPLLLLLVCWD